MSVKKKEVTLLMKICVIASACALTASMTWILAKRTYERKDDPRPSPINKWKIARLTIGALWVMKRMVMEFPFRWIHKKLKNLERIQELFTNIKPMDLEEYNSKHKHSKRTFDRYPRAPRHRAQAAMGINEQNR